MSTEQLTNVQQTVKEGQEKYSRTNGIMVSCGIGGLALAILLLFGIPGCNKGRFHEININLKKADSEGREKLIKTIPVWKNTLEMSLTTLKLASPPDEDAISNLKKKIDSVTQLQYLLLTEKNNSRYSNSDTFSNLMSRLSLHREDLLDKVITFAKSTKDSLTFNYAIPGYTHPQIIVKVRVESIPLAGPYYLVTKYPNFGFWAFIAIFFMVMCALMLPICWFMFKTITKEIKLLNSTKGNGRSFAMAFAGITIFCFLLYGGMLQTSIADDKFFMSGFTVAIRFYTVLGYVVAVCCFAGYLYIADFIHQLQAAFKKGMEKLQDLISVETANAGTDKEKLAAIPELPAVKAQQLENEAIKEHFKNAKKYFNIFFWMSALVLSVAVLMTASLFSSFNSMDVFQYYRHISGKNFLSADLVFLYGGMHTILLLIYVLPVKFKMYDMNLTIPDLQNGNTVDDKTVKGALSGLSKTIGEILVIASPLLASFLENVISTFLN